MRVLFVTQYGSKAASSRTRVLQYLPYLQQQGLDTHVITVLPDRAIAGTQIDVRRQPWRKISYYLWAAWRTWSCGLRVCWGGFRHDILFIQKVILPSPLRWLLRWISAPIVYDFDDAIFTTEIRSGHWLARLKEARNARGLPAMLSLAQLAVVENDYTADFAKAHCDVLKITGPIDTSPYAKHDSTVEPEVTETADSPIVLGWIGSGSTVAYLELIGPILQQLAQHYCLRLLVVGATYELPGVDVQCKPWALDEEATDLATCHIGLMPVPDDPWTRGKGGYKLLQYMAGHLPVVAHPVGINTQIVEDGSNGFLASDSDTWVKCLTQLCEDPVLRRRMGERGRARVESKYSLASQQPRLLNALRALEATCS
ncbi:MAG: glycosyltransferase family 4 protein [Gemmatimonadetes bacterium]|nr:glycosyltransferase family 4 protein [Gemmatimonadota bacterium]MBT5060693.1 glycosyltransferase family 4 protein [Gemmatimonadota bacterium]MBT5145397.1 glycosyltransferase family 4 protein [Gemmatimonadota bacterium]MBT5591585.1 glycosyltransferase family 4 protein [Gemmatimonadota bacterium]MBT5961960.1 glycosyltransferase family 4 protein [Gemmatimonadota bacterium]